MELLEALITRRILKAYFPGLGKDTDISAADALDMLNYLLYSASETIKESGNDYRGLIQAMEESITLVAQAASQGY